MIISLKAARSQDTGENDGNTESPKSRGSFTREFLFAKDAWLPQSILRPAALGVTMGLVSFWHGSILIALLVLAFFIAIFSKHRLEHLIMAGISTAMAYIITGFFVKSGDSIVRFDILVGFMSDQNTLPGILSYYVELLGILPLILLVSIFFIPRGSKVLILIFITPLILATTVRLSNTTDVNHKYVNISIILLNILAAYFIYRLFTSKKKIAAVLGAVLILTMTLTGIVDIITVNTAIGKGQTMAVDLDNTVTSWAIKNTNPQRVFLSYSPHYRIDPIAMAGRKLFNGSYIFAASAGYNATERINLTNRVYSSDSYDEVKKIIHDNKISYIIVDEAVKTSKEFTYNESIIIKNCILVYTNASMNIQIYKTDFR